MRKYFMIGILFFSLGYLYSQSAVKYFQIQYTDEQYKAVNCYVYDPKAWLQDAWDNKARRRIDKVIEDHTTHNYKKLNEQEKINIISNLTLKVADDPNKPPTHGR